MSTSTATRSMAPVPPADRFMRRVLRVGNQTSTPQAAQKALQTSLLISTVRCTVMYLILPFVAPTLGWIGGVSTAVSVVISVVAMASIVLSMRRFWRCNHPRRWAYTWFGGAFFVGLAVLLVRDLVQLLS